MCFNPSDVKFRRKRGKTIGCDEPGSCCSTGQWQVVEVLKGTDTMDPNLFTLAVDSSQPDPTTTYGTLTRNTSSKGTYSLRLNCGARLTARV